MKNSDDKELVNDIEQEAQKQDLSEQSLSTHQQMLNESDDEPASDDIIPDDLTLDSSSDISDPEPDVYDTSENDQAQDCDPDNSIGTSDEEITASSTDESTEDTEASLADAEFSSEENDIIEKAKDKKERIKVIDQLFDLVEMAVFTIVAVFIITTFFFKYSIVQGSSMKNTLEHNDKLLLYNFLYEPECGDIVVLQDNITTGLDHAIVKRVIATGGQRVKVTATQIYVDGIPLNEKYVYTGDNTNLAGIPTQYFYNVSPSQNILPIVTDEKPGEYYEITVPEGEIFVMGDHRNNSDDSRKFGTFNEDAVIGKAILRLFPFEKID